MKVDIRYHDDVALTVEEIVANAHRHYGKDAEVRVTSDSLAPHDQIYFALQQMITHKQLSLFYDNKFSYQQDIKGLRTETLIKLQEILDTVIIDNESKVA